LLFLVQNYYADRSARKIMKIYPLPLFPSIMYNFIELRKELNVSPFRAKKLLLIVSLARYLRLHYVIPLGFIL